MAATLRRVGTTVEVATPFDPLFIAGLKAQIPSAARTWRKPVWIVDGNYFDIVHALCVDAFGPATVTGDPTVGVQPETRRVLIEYLARVKDDGFALGWANGGWTLRLSEFTLRAFFEDIWVRNGKRTPTLYSELGIRRDAGADEIMRAYRRAAFTWHPDRCTEPDAKERFIQIKHAFDTLSDPAVRAKYDAGLRLQEANVVASLDRRVPSTMSQLGFAPPVRCGRVSCTGVQGVRFDVEAIHAWDDDILQVAHLKLIRVAYWPAGAKSFETRWEVL